MGKGRTPGERRAWRSPRASPLFLLFFFFLLLLFFLSDGLYSRIYGLSAFLSLSRAPGRAMFILSTRVAPVTLARMLSLALVLAPLSRLAHFRALHLGPLCTRAVLSTHVRLLWKGPAPLSHIGRCCVLPLNFSVVSAVFRFSRLAASWRRGRRRRRRCMAALRTAPAVVLSLARFSVLRCPTLTEPSPRASPWFSSTSDSHALLAQQQNYS